ncbi:MAG: choice-of-anchor J domain-containing protein [Crocinitomicaceae bacterium]|nr:choice-of-anchor J domain-containing protein [Crocinitomicaceae bacterium]
MTKIFPLFLLLSGYTVFGQSVIYSTDFQSGIPNEFTLIDNDLNIPATQVSEFDAAWICVSDPENPTDSVAASTSYFNMPDTADRWMITPSLALGSFGNKFYWNAKSQDASFPDDYYVLVSVTDNAPESFLDTVGHIVGENFEWTERSIDLSGLGYNDQSIFVAFVLRTYDGFKLYIDDIEALKEDETGIDENMSFSFNLYPVPVKETLNISSQATISSITISNTHGALIYHGNSTSVDVSRFPKGPYFIKVKTDKGTAAKMFIKQ